MNEQLTPAALVSGEQLNIDPDVQSFLRIYAPRNAGSGMVTTDGEKASRERAPVSLAFSRTREVPLSWWRLKSGMGAKETSGVDTFRSFLETSWNRPVFEDLETLLGKRVLLTSKDEPLYRFGKKGDEGNLAVASVSDGELLFTDEERTELWVAELKKTKEGKKASPEDIRTKLLSAKTYTTVWEEGISSVFRVYGTEEANTYLRDSVTDYLTSKATTTDDPDVGDALAEFSAAPQGTRKTSFTPNHDDAFDSEKFRLHIEALWKCNPIESNVLKDVLAFTKHKGDYKRVTGWDAKKRTWITSDLEPNEALLKHLPSGRVYWLIRKEGHTQTLSINTPETYESAWASQIEGIELVRHKTDEPSLAPWTHLEEIDLGLYGILEEFQRLDVHELVEEKVSRSYETLLSKAAENPSGQAQIENFRKGYERARVALERVRLQKKTLQQRAAALNKFLALEDNENPNPAADPAIEAKVVNKMKRGHLYESYRDTAHWTETKKVKIRIQLLFGISIRRTLKRKMKRSKEFLNYKEVVVDLEPWIERRKILEEDGFDCAIFELTDAGYISESGESLDDLMRRCNLEEETRRRTAVFLPIYEQHLIKGQVKTKYLVVTCPLPGEEPISLPKIYIQESLTYRMEWKGTELGPLIRSLNLAPGESRTITVNRQYSQKTTSARSVTSVLDVTQSSTQDISSAIEREARDEQEQKSTKSWNVKAGGAWGPFSASAGASGTSSMNTKSFARNMQTMAKKAAESLSRNTSDTISTSESESIEVSSEDSSVGTISNINQGRTLNLLFYRLNSIYDAGLYLEELKLVVIPGTECIAGTGIQVPIDLCIVR